MKHKVSELSGALLDAAVEQIEAARFGMSIGPWHRCDQWHKNWGVAGPIIEREHIALQFLGVVSGWDARCDRSTDGQRGGSAYAQGPTALVAAMRAFVVAKMGEEVDL